VKLESGVDVVDIVDSIAIKLDGIFAAIASKNECCISETPFCFVAGTLRLIITQDEGIKLNAMLVDIKSSKVAH
jgi:hypothetical protein